VLGDPGQPAGGAVRVAGHFGDPQLAVELIGLRAVGEIQSVGRSASQPAPSEMKKSSRALVIPTRSAARA
jgi:hypothetical protein